MMYPFHCATRLPEIGNIFTAYYRLLSIEINTSSKKHLK